jgi:hypothetical protein
MPHVDLPRALEDYFAHAETTPTRDGRRFSITFPYLQGAKLDSLQWWWNIGSVQLQLIGDEGFAAQRRSAIEKFSRHIERWLVNNDQRLYGDGPIPRLEARLNAVSVSTDRRQNPPSPPCAAAPAAAAPRSARSR